MVMVKFEFTNPGDNSDKPIFISVGKKPKNVMGWLGHFRLGLLAKPLIDTAKIFGLSQSSSIKSFSPARPAQFRAFHQH